MNETQVNNFLSCLLQIDDLNYLALQTRYKVSNDQIHDQDDDEDHDHDHDEYSSNDLLIAKTTAMVVLFFASTLCGSIPFLLNHIFKWSETNANARSKTVVKVLLHFGGGVLMATTFLHLLPEVQEIVEELQDCNSLPQLSFNLAELLMCSGFFLMYITEEILHSCMYRHKRLMDGDGGAGAAFERGRSVRNSYLVRGTIKASTALGEEHSKSRENYVAKLENNSNTKAEIPLATSVSDKPVRSGSISMQNLVSNDIEDQKYSQHQCKKNMSGNSQFQEQNEQKETHEISQAQKTHISLQRQHRDRHLQKRGHSHLPLDIGNDSDDAITTSLRGLFIVLALSLHELFEGMVIGLEGNAQDVWFMFGAVSAHKFVLAFCVGVELIVIRARLVLCTVYILTFAIVSPIGIGLGILISHNDDTASPTLLSAILQGFACGTLLYVVFFEILSKDHSGLIVYLSLVVGFLVMFGLQQLGANGHGHNHGGCSASQDHNHDGNYDQEQTNLLLLKETQSIFANQAPVYTLHPQHQHHERSFDANSNFGRELEFLRQASEKLIQNNKKIN